MKDWKRSNFGSNINESRYHTLTRDKEKYQKGLRTNTVAYPTIYMYVLPPHFYYALEYNIRKVQEIQEELEWTEHIS
jgi:hypothetical protein